MNPSSTTTNLRCFKVILVLLVQILAFVTCQTQTANTQLTANSPVNCDDIIDVSTFEGNCCSLNVTDGNGCVLNVVNGRCKVRRSPPKMYSCRRSILF